MDMLGGFFLWQNISKLVSFPFSEEKGPGDGGRTGITPWERMEGHPLQGSRDPFYRKKLFTSMFFLPKKR